MLFSVAAAEGAA